MKSKSKAYQPKTLLLDLENTPLIGASWGMREQDILWVEEHSYILSIAYQWYPEQKITVKSLRDFPSFKKDHRDDERLVKFIFDLIEKADVVVVQNGLAFDLKVLNNRFSFYRVGIPKRLAVVDTLRILRATFRLPSNKLDEVCQYFGIGMKMPHTGKNLWRECRAGDEKAFELMEKYNEHDVYLLRKLYELIGPWSAARDHINLNLLTGERSCPFCQGKQLQKRGHARTLNYIYQIYHCVGCGKRVRGPNEKADSKIELRPL